MVRLDDIEENEFDTVEDFFEFISQHLVTRDCNYGFRGVSSEAYRLEPTFTRYLREVEQAHYKVRHGNYRESVLRLLYHTFKKNIVVNNDIAPENLDKTDLWQYGQHFGLPTPYLDWSYSPYIALFFAIRNKVDDNRRRCVWSINLDLVDLLNTAIVEEVRPRKQEFILSEETLNNQFPILEIVSELNEYNKRIAFQQGFFAKQHYYASLEIWLARIVEQLHYPLSGSPVLKKFTFGCEETSRFNVLDKLSLMNINHRTLFPDIYGSVYDAIDSTLRSYGAPFRAE